MNTFFKKAEADRPEHRYVFAHEFSGLKDPLDADELWKPPSLMGGGGRLYSVLDELAFKVNGHDRRVFAHIELEMPAEIVFHDRRIARGERTRALERELSARHRKAYGKLLGGRDPRYVVRAVKDLAPGAVRVRLGQGVFNPVADEAPRYAIDATGDGGNIYVPIGSLFDPEGLFLIGADRNRASAVAPGWPFAAAVVIMEVDGSLDLSAEPFGSLTIEPAGDSVYVLQGRAADGSEARYHLRVRRQAAAVPPVAAPEPARHRPIIIAKDPGAERIEPQLSEAMTSPDTPAPDESGEGTLLGTSFAPSPDESGTLLGMPALRSVSHQLSLAGLVLPRPTTFGVAGLQFHFNAQGSLCDDEAEALLTIRVHADDTLGIQTAAGSRPITAGETLMVGAHRLTVLSSPEDLDAAALVCFDTPLVEAISNGVALNFGRGSRASKRLRVLGGRRHCVVGKHTEVERLGFSSHHLEYEATADGLAVRAGSAIPVVVLDASLSPAGLITNESDAPTVVASGTHLVAGPYLLRYEQA